MREAVRAAGGLGGSGECAHTRVPPDSRPRPRIGHAPSRECGAPAGVTTNDRESDHGILEDAPDDVWERTRDGDPSALADLLAAHAGDIESFIRSHMPRALVTKESVGDLTQSLVGDLLPEISRASFDNQAAFRGWLRQCARNKIRERLRHWNAGRRDHGRDCAMQDVGEECLCVDQTTPSEAAQREESNCALHGALEKLTEEQRRLVVLVKFEGRSYAEASAVLGRSPAACRKMMARTLSTLAGLLPDARHPDARGDHG